jgi:hypothetical protein
MSAEVGNAPSWLFSFVDLAFLSMIAMTQLSSDISTPAPDLGELVIPDIGKKVTSELATGAKDLWQLRVYPPSEEHLSPFELTDGSNGLADAGAGRLSVEELRERLRALRDGIGRKPLLAPHADSRSQDMLSAAALIEEFWPSRRRALVARRFEAP